MDQNFSTPLDKGPWVQVTNGTMFYPLAPTEDMIVLDDITASLSKKCRFNGHCLEFVSVAEHSIMVYNILMNEMNIEDPRILLQGLLHDAAEAYLCDVPKPIKSCLVGFQDIENRILDVVMAKFEVPTQGAVLDRAIHHADHIGAIYEFSQNMDHVNAALLPFDLIPQDKIPNWGKLGYIDPEEADLDMWHLVQIAVNNVRRVG